MRHKRSVNFSKISVIVEQSESLKNHNYNQSRQTCVGKSNRKRKVRFNKLEKVDLRPPKQRMMDLLGEKGSSSWLSVLPLKDQGFNLNKGEFRDALNLRYGL